MRKLLAVTATLCAIAWSGAAWAQTGVAMTAPFRMVDTNFFQFGFGMGANWSKTSANDFGAGLGGSTVFDHTFSSSFLSLNAGYFVPVFPGVAFGPVVQLVGGDMGGGNGLSLTTPSGIVGTSLVRRDYGVDAMGRIYFNPGWYGNVFIEGGAEFARYNASMVNAGVEVFQGSTTTTSPIFGGGIQFPLCGLIAMPANNGICSLQGVVQFDHVSVNKSFIIGDTALSSATTQVKSENRVMAGVELTAYDPLQRIIQQGAASLSDIRLKRDIVEVGHLDNGLGLYTYRYWWSDQVYVGVMAQEVAQVVPEAVMMAPDGYLRVDYAKLGTRLQTYEQ